jgi:hypothetical protein
VAAGKKIAETGDCFFGSIASHLVVSASIYPGADEGKPESFRDFPPVKKYFKENHLQNFILLLL